MGKTVTLNRRELVWEEYSVSWTAEDWQRLLDWLKSFKDREDRKDTWVKNKVLEYDALSQYSWDQIAEMIEHGTNEDEPKVPYVGHDGEIWYTSLISDVVIEYLREECYESDCIGSEYADDYDEDFYFGEDGR